MKKLLALMLSMLMLVGAVPALGYTPGTYTGEGQGNNGPVTVEVTFADDAITAITVVKHGETAGIADAAIERIPAAIVEHQSLAVDVVSSATNTSRAILSAVEDAAAKAGADVEALKSAAVEKAAPGEAVSMDVDVVVVGGGGAGLAAAMTAAEAGAKVVLLEKTAIYGGNTILSGGYFQAAVEELSKTVEMTDGQKSEVERYLALEPKNDIMAAWQATAREQFDAHLAAGNTYLFDSPELHMIQTYDGGDYLGKPELIEMMCKGDVEAFNFLQDNGMVWKQNAVAIVGSIWMRCHAAQDYASGQGFIVTMADAIEKKGLDVTTIFECRAERLIQDESGRVVGVTATGLNGTPYTFNAAKGVVLACGGFGANVEMRMEYDELWGNLTESVPTTNAPSITGDGIVMALEVGANLIDMGQIQLLPTADPVTGQTNNVIGEGTNMYVNQNGERFVDESSRRDILAKAILEQPGQYCYVISTFWNSRMDEEYKNNYHMYLDDLIASGAVQKGDTLEALAEAIGVPVDAFVKTCENFNQYVADSNDTEFGRVVFPANAALEMEGPFYACKRAPAVHHTMGGIDVNTDNAALSTDGTPIPGLFAAGEVTGGFHGSNRLGGNAVAEAIATGRNAGANVVK